MGLSKIGDENKGIQSPREISELSIAAGCQGIIPTAAYTCDAAGLITYFNPLAEAIWGRPPKLRDVGERFCGSHQLYLSDGTRISRQQCWMALALIEGTSYYGREIVMERMDGGRTAGVAYVHPIRNVQDEVIGAVALVAELSARPLAWGNEKNRHFF